MLDAASHSHLRLPAVLDSVRCVVIELDRHGHILSFNSEAERLHRCGQADVMGAAYHELFIPKEHRQSVVERASDVLRSGAALGMRYPIDCRDGVRRQVLWNLTKVEPENGEPILVAVGQDLTDVLEAQRRAELGVIAAEVVHDIGNPLTSLGLLVAQLVRMACDEPSLPIAELEHDLGELEQCVARIVGLVQRFKHASKRAVVVCELLDVRSVLLAVVQDWRRVGAARAVEVIAELTEGLSLVRGDAEQLRRVCDNLIQNAFDAIGDGEGRVVVRAHQHDDRVRVEVADSGGGSAPASDPFELFHTTKPLGSGIGLNVVRRIIEAHGGIAGCEANVPHGMLFYFELPSISGKEAEE